MIEMTEALRNIEEMIKERQQLYFFYKEREMHSTANQMIKNIETLHEVKARLFKEQVINNDSR